MKTVTTQWVSDLPRYIVIAVLSAFLVGCGGSSGDSEDDTDGDGIPDAIDSDADGDGLIDEGKTDTDGDGTIDSADLDADGNGIDDFEETGTTVEGDLDGDGFTDVTDLTPCGGEAGSDNASNNNTWDDNCTVRRQISGGQFADSLYTAGVQRVIYCAGFGSASSVTEFVDGEFGPGTEQALIDYQNSKSLTADGVVGMNTWARLREELELESPANVPNDGSSAYDGFSVPGDRCGNSVLFYQEVRQSGDSIEIDRLGWTLAQSPGSDQRVPFSIASPFNQIE